MAVIDDLKPQDSARVIDLVAAAGHNVSDWKNFAGGVKKEASNPKYCYEWAFTQAGKAIVLNLWHEQLEEVFGQVVQRLNYRQHAAMLPQTGARGMWAKRAKAMDDAFALAAARALPVRVIICDGQRRDVTKDPDKSSIVSRRLLDPIPWAVSSYNIATGYCILTRGEVPHAVEDQFCSIGDDNQLPNRRLTVGNQFVRNSLVRESVLARAKGYCEYCSAVGFQTRSGATYLETHHIVALADQGMDNDLNVIALCPNDHRRAHHSADAENLRKEFQRIVAARIKLER